LKWTDQENCTTPVTASVDVDGFFLYYIDQRTEMHILDIAHVRDVRTGLHARTPKDPKIRELVSLGPGMLEDKTVTIVYGTDYVNLNYVNFCTNKAEVAGLWCHELSKLVREHNPLLHVAGTSLTKIHRQILLSSSEEQKLPTKTILKTFAQSKEARKTIEKALDLSGLPSAKADEIERSAFRLHNFQEFYLKLVQRKEITTIFQANCKSTESKKNVMSVKEFQEFLNTAQRDPRLNEILHPYANEDKTLNLIKKYEPNSHLVSLGQLSVEGFLWFLMSEDNNIISQEKLEKEDDMERPLSHYFINSSHNTYLTGHQLRGRASLEMYRQVLLSGCRCIELDFWNGQKDQDDEPHITHGYTLVVKIPARDVLQTIAAYAFKTSDLPLILSFENHCNPKQQAKIAKYCEEFFGDLMLQEPLVDFPLDREVPLPCPNLLRNKILIKNKKQHHFINKNLTGAKLASSPSSPAIPESSPDHRITNNNNNNNGYSDDSDSEDSDSDDDGSESSENTHKEIVTSDAGTAGKESQASAEISALVNYVQPVKFRSFEHAEKRKRSFEMSSFVETNAMTQLKNDPVEFVKYNKFQIARVYPKGTRVDSSNFMPHMFWNAGCQLVALNFQSLDVPMQLNLGIFQFNQGTGYLLKPEVMRRDDRKFDPFTQSSVDNIVPATLSIQVLSGQFLTDKHVGTFVEVEMYGLPCDTVRRERKFKTRTVLNGLNPIFSEDPFVFRQVILPDLAVVRISAYEESGNKFIGHRVLPVTGLCPGYRHIPLFNESGQPLHLPCLFVNIEVKDYVPNRLNVYAEALANPIKYQQDILAERTKALEALEDEVAPVDPGTDGGESTPECASPTRSTLDILKRTGSAKPRTKADGSPTLGLVHRTNSNKSLSSRGDDRRGSVSLQSKDLTPDTLEEILEYKAVKDKEAELSYKLEQLAKKRHKDLLKLEASKSSAEDKLTRVPSRTKNSLKGIVQKFSTVSLVAPLVDNAESTIGSSSASYSPGSTNTGTQDDMEDKLKHLARTYNEKAAGFEQRYLQDEFELREKYLDMMLHSAEKNMQKSQACQLKSLENLYNKESSEVLKRIESEDKCQNDKLEHGNVSREDIQRERRERLVKKGYHEKSKLKELYDGRKRELIQAQERRKKELVEEWEKRRRENKAEHKRRSEQIRLISTHPSNS